jgi:hypothetical protein
MEEFYSGMLIEEGGAFVNEAEIIDPVNESHLKIKLVRGRLYVRVLKRSLDVKPSIPHVLLMPGTSLSGSSTVPRLVVQFPPFVDDESSTVKLQFVVTWSALLCVSFRLRILMGDLIEEFGQKRLKMSTHKARRWMLKQIARSIMPVCWQILRYDLIPGLKSWLLWTGRLEPRSASAQ